MRSCGIVRRDAHLRWRACLTLSCDLKLKPPCEESKCGDDKSDLDLGGLQLLRYPAGNLKAAARRRRAVRRLIASIRGRDPDVRISDFVLSSERQVRGIATKETSKEAALVLYPR